MHVTLTTILFLLCTALAQPAAALQGHYDPHNRIPRAVIAPDIAPDASLYFGRVTAHILAHLPPSVCTSGEWIQFQIAVDMRGRVDRVEPHAWNASKPCFAAVSAAIVDHSPLPVPPTSLRDLLWRGGLIFTFTQRTAQAAHHPKPVPPRPAASVQLNRYRAQVTQRFLRTWQKERCATGMHVTYRVTITADGTIAKIRKDNSSASGACEDAALETINRASPLPTPPAVIAKRVLNEQFRITFRR